MLPVLPDPCAILVGLRLGARRGGSREGVLEVESDESNVIGDACVVAVVLDVEREVVLANIACGESRPLHAARTAIEGQGDVITVGGDLDVDNALESVTGDALVRWLETRGRVHAKHERERVVGALL